MKDVKLSVKIILGFITLSLVTLIVGFKKRIAEDAALNASATSAKAKTIVVLGMVIGTILAIALVIILNNTITKPIDRISKGLKMGAEQLASAALQVSSSSNSLARGASEQATSAESSFKVGELVAEIAAASNEQAQGIDQINKAVCDMDRVTQQNAASSEESASTSEEMSAQAEEMKRFVDELVMLVDGRKNGNNNWKDMAQFKEISVMKSAPVGKQKKLSLASLNAEGGRNAFQKIKEVPPEQVIPLDDDLKDF